MEKFVLGLELPTDPVWAEMVIGNLEDILTDHAWCEQKAASTCISLVVKFSYIPQIVEALSPVITEEWGHFRMVLRELKKRGLTLGTQRKDEYVNQIKNFVRKGVSREEHIVDNLLLSGLIEARSCERFRLLHLALEDVELKQFYYDLMVAEASHYRMFLDLAATILPEEIVRIRWKEFLAMEAEVVSNLEVKGDRMH